MKSATSTAIRVMFYGLTIGLLGVAISLVPGGVSAAEISAQSVQILPLGGANQCVNLPITGFTPYVYDGALNSFDFSYPDASYVAIVGSVGDEGIPLRYMRRQIDQSGAIHMHVDIDTTPVVGTLPLTFTLLSARGAGQPVCATTITILMHGTSAPSVPTAPTPPAIVAPTPMPTSQGSTTSTSSVVNDVSTTASPGIINGPFARVCASTSDVFRLWAALLVLYVLFLGALIWAKWPSTWDWIRTTEWRLTLILLPLVLLLALWYFSPACRGAGWLPLIAVASAAASSFFAFKPEEVRNTQLLLIDQDKKK